MWADLKDLNGTRFIVVDVHLVSGKGKGNDDERTREMTALINGIKKINPSGLPVIYAGDFNSNASNANQSKYKGGYDAPLRSFSSRWSRRLVSTWPSRWSTRPGTAPTRPRTRR